MEATWYLPSLQCHHTCVRRKLKLLFEMSEQEPRDFCLAFCSRGLPSTFGRASCCGTLVESMSSGGLHLFHGFHVPKPWLVVENVAHLSSCEPLGCHLAVSWHLPASHGTLDGMELCHELSWMQCIA